MSDSGGPVLELTIRRDGPADALEGDVERLAERIRDLSAGSDVRSYDDPDVGGAPARLLRVRFIDEAHLQQFLETPEHGVDALVRANVGEPAGISQRILREHLPGDDALGVSRCLNCDAILTGQYCGSCGQRAQDRLISLFELLKDAFGDLFELDSRLWRTLRPLAFRPGKLTREYLDGRRARYMPPFRMYLVLSLAFFVIAFFDPAKDLGILFADDGSGAESSLAASGAQDEEGPSTGEAGEDKAAGPDVDARLTWDVGGGRREFRERRDCQLEGYDTSEFPDWVARRFTRERVQAACENIIAEDGSGWQGVLDRVVENIPAGLFVLLPVMALVLKLLYPLSRRYYVEHLLFVVHYHAFVFLLLTLGVLFTRAADGLGLPVALAAISDVAAGLYIPVYLYKSQRRVYGQSHWLTLPKFLALVVIYATGLAMIMAVAGILAAFSL